MSSVGPVEHGDRRGFVLADRELDFRADLARWRAIRMESARHEEATDMQKKTWLAIGTVLWLLASVPAVAQEWAGRGRLQGEIKDEQGQPIDGALLTFRMGTGRVDAN